MSLKQQQRRRGRLAGIVVCISALLLCVCTGIVLVALTRAGTPPPSKQGDDPYAAAGRLPGYGALTEQPDTQNFFYLLSARPYYKSGSQPGNVLIENTPGNAYPMRVAFLLGEDSRQVYCSGLVQPGWHITEAPLDVELEKGVYPAQAIITVLEPDTMEEMARFTEEITLYIGKKP